MGHGCLLHAQDIGAPYIHRTLIAGGLRACGTWGLQLLVNFVHVKIRKKSKAEAGR
jgi:hypothetical protein